MHETLSVLRTMAGSELKNLADSGKLSCNDWEFAKCLLSAVSKIDTISAMEEAGYSERRGIYRDGGVSYAADSRRGMGIYPMNGYRDGMSYAADGGAEQMRRELENLYRRTSDEQTRREVQNMLQRYGG